jgi:hypothetical protein
MDCADTTESVTPSGNMPTIAVSKRIWYNESLKTVKDTCG